MRISNPSSGGVAALTPQNYWLALLNGTNEWTAPGWNISDPGSGASLAQDQITAFPIYVQRAMTVTAIAIHVISGGAATGARLGIYEGSVDADGVISAGALLLDAGVVDTTLAGEKSITISQALSAGWYFLCVSPSTNLTCNGFSRDTSGTFLSSRLSALNSDPPNGLRGVHSPGEDPLPDPFPTTTIGENMEHNCVYIRPSFFA